MDCPRATARWMLMIYILSTFIPREYYGHWQIVWINMLAIWNWIRSTMSVIDCRCLILSEVFIIVSVSDGGVQWIAPFGPGRDGPQGVCVCALRQSLDGVGAFCVWSSRCASICAEFDRGVCSDGRSGNESSILKKCSQFVCYLRFYWCWMNLESYGFGVEGLFWCWGQTCAKWIHPWGLRLCM